MIAGVRPPGFMTGLRHRLLAGLMLLLTLPPLPALELTDATGTQLRIDPPVERIISLSPHLTENLFAIGQGHRLVGTISHSLHPPEARELPRVGRYDRLDRERLLALKPDLVLAWLSGNGPDQIRQLRALGLRVLALETRGVDELGQTLRLLGNLTGTPEGDRLARRLEKGFDALSETYADKKPVPVFYQVWAQPLMTVGQDQIIHRLLERCGARNVFGDQPGQVLTVSREAVISRAPQAIVATPDPQADGNPLAHWRDYPVLPAVQGEHLILLENGDLARPVPAMLDASRQLCRRIDAVRASSREAPP